MEDQVKIQITCIVEQRVELSMTTLSLSWWRLGSTWPELFSWATHVDGWSYGRVELCMLKEELMAELSWLSWRGSSWSSWAEHVEGCDELSMQKEKLLLELSTLKIGWANHAEERALARAELSTEHVEGGTHGRAELAKLKGKLMVELS
jgi:hypothetical protein